MLKHLILVALVAPAASLAGDLFSGTWQLVPERTTFLPTPVTITLDRGTFQRADCRYPLSIPADGHSHPVAGASLFDSISVRVIDRHRTELVQTMDGRVVWKGVYRVAPDKRSMELAFEDDRAGHPVSGVIAYSRSGQPSQAASALSGEWQPVALKALSDSGKSLEIALRDDGIGMRWADGRGVDSHLDTAFYPVSGFVNGAAMSVLRSRPELLAMNLRIGADLVEIARATVSPDGMTLTLQKSDQTCHEGIVLTYRK